MADIDTSFYPKSQPINLLGIASEAQSIANARQQNQLLQTENQRAQVGLSQAHVDLAHQQYGILSSALGTLAQDPRISTAQGPALLQQTTQQLLKAGIITPEIAQAELANAPSDPANLPQYLQTLNTRVLDGQQKFSQIYGTPGTIDNGSTVQPVTASAITGVRPIAAPIAKTTSPEDRNTLVPGVNQAGQTYMAPKANMLAAAGVDPYTGKPSNPTGTFQAPSQGGAVVTSPPAGQIDAQSAASKASSERYSADAARETQYQQNALPMQQAYQSVKALGATGVGPGTEQLNQVKSFLVSSGIMSADDKLTNYDEASKYLSQMARQNGFTGSDAQLDAAQKASPSMKTSSGAALGVLQKMIAMNRLGNAQVRAFEQSGKNPSEYSKWAADWNAKQNAAAYAFDLMEPQDRLAYIKTLSPEKAAAFKDSLVQGVKLGIIDRPSAAPSTAAASGVPNGG